jgi:hypothetical protein
MLVADGTTYFVEGDDGVMRWEPAHVKSVISTAKGGLNFQKDISCSRTPRSQTVRKKKKS